MIANATETGWELIYQQAHALLAAKLVTYWRHSERPVRWTETLAAVANHDHGWQEWESGTRLTPAGTPLGFMETPLDDIVAQSERAVIRAWHHSLWVGLLVSHHLSWLHEEKRGQSKALDQLLDSLKAERREWRQTLKVKGAEVEEAYALLRWADTFSLILCMRQLPFRGRHIEIGAGHDGTRYDLRQREDGTITVEPWPYTEDQFLVSVDAYNVEQLTFQDAASLAAHLHATRATPLSWELRK